ncbi:MAG: hypothetical protein ACTTID_03985 [Bacillales bacterium]
MNDKYKNLETIDIWSKSIEYTKDNVNPDTIIKKYLDNYKIPYFITIPSILYKNNIISKNNEDNFWIVNYKSIKEYDFDLLEGQGLSEDNKLQFLCSVKDRKYKNNNYYDFLSPKIENFEFSETTTGLNQNFKKVKCVGKFYHYPPIFGRYSQYKNPIMIINDDKLYNKLLDNIFTKYVYCSNHRNLLFTSNLNKFHLNELKNTYNNQITLKEVQEDTYLFNTFNVQEMHDTSTVVSNPIDKRELRKNIYLFYFIFSTIFIYLYYIVINYNSAFDNKISIYLLCGGNKKSIILSKFIQILLFLIVDIVLITIYVNYNYTHGIIKIFDYLQSNMVSLKTVTSPKFLYIGIILFLISFLITGTLHFLKFRKLNISQILKNKN